MRVLHIIPTLSSGGAEKMLVDILEEMNKSGIHVEVLVLSQRGDFYSKEIQRMGIPVHFGKVGKVYHPSHIVTVRNFMRKNFDIIHTHLFAPQLYTALAKKTLLKKNRLITTEHNTHNRRREKKFFKLLDKYMYAQYDRIIAITKATKQELNNYLPSTKNKTVVIENGIKVDYYKNASSFNPSDLIGDYRRGDVLILMVAAMRAQKDHETVIRASRLLSSHYHVVFVGDGERMKEVQNYAQQNGSPNIHFLGRRSDVPSIMKTCNVFVLSSYWEGFGLVAVEAMAAGLPVVASNVAGLKEVVQDVDGLLFEPGNEHDLVEKIKQAAKNNTVTKPKQLEKYHIASMVSNYLELYQQTIHSTRPKGRS